MTTTINLEITNKCNAQCITCPRSEIKNLGEMSIKTFKLFLERVYQDKNNIKTVNMSGYGETITHKKFFEIIELIRNFKKKADIEFSLVTNAQDLNLKKLRVIDGVIKKLKISFATINKENYEKIHQGLKYETSLKNTLLAIKSLKKTSVVIHLTPTKFTMEEIEPSVRYWREKGVKEIVLFPFTFNRAGNLQIKNTHLEINQKRNLILARKLKLRQLEEVFKISFKDIMFILKKKNFCLAGLASLYIDYKGNYHFCFNDISSKHLIGNLKKDSISDILKKREKLYYSDKLCPKCNLKDSVSKRSIIEAVINSILATRVK